MCHMTHIYYFLKMTTCGILNQIAPIYFTFWQRAEVRDGAGAEAGGAGAPRAVLRRQGRRGRGQAEAQEPGLALL